MVRVGLTGGIATGKSTVSRLFVECGASLVDADSLAREVVEPGKPAWKEIVEAFGRDILRADGTVDRERLGRLVFGSPAQLERLNAIVHPHVFAEEERLSRKIAAANPHAVVIFDAALLIETGAHKSKDRVIVVTADTQTQLDRLMARDRLTADEAQQRIAAQMPMAEKIKVADYVLDGALPHDRLRREVQRIYRDLQQLA
jgi:dephospho-CoA kinase